MQQASSSLNNLVSTTGTSFSQKAVSPPRFVVNLCASTTPVGLVQPSHAGLKRFTFFVSRRLEEGRERFRLHMGYFESQEEAEKMLDLVRDVYPAAWAGVAPGIKLRARAALPEPAAPEVPAAAAIPAAPPAPAVVAPVAVAPSPVVQPAKAVAAPSARAPAPLKLELAPDLPRARPTSDLSAPSVKESAPVTKQSEPAGKEDATRSLSDVRATIASLGDPVEAPAQSAEPVLEGAAVLRLLTSARPATAARLMPSAPGIKNAAVKGSPEKAAPSATRATPAAPTAAAPEPALFAVQLLWSVKPIDMSQVPQLAIFSAYTLYGAEGNRDGRRWYGLRLGFFTDAVSAKQVAQYVRSEFTSVSVVPVTDRERTRAGATAAKPLPAPSPPKNETPELNFINDVATDTATSGSRPALEASANASAKTPPTLRPAVVSALGMGSKPTPGKRAKARNGTNGKAAPKKPARPLSLEETLEILGAGQLQVQTERRDLLSESAVRERKPATPNQSRFSRLILRLADRFGNG
jgi:hypothetical protein